MGQIRVDNFKHGLDRRRPRVAGIAGTLWDAKNCHLTRGGDVQSPRKFVSRFVLPVGTFGLMQAAGQLFTIGSADLAATVPLGIQYLRCQAEVAANMIHVLDAKAYQGGTYVIAEYDDGIIRHFFNTVRLTQWDAISDANSSINTTAAYLASKMTADSAVAVSSAANVIIVAAKVPGVDFSIAVAAYDGGGINDQTMVLATPQANVPAVLEVAATATVTISGGSSNPGVNQVQQITVGAVNLLTAPIDWFLTNEATAAAIVAAINDNAAGTGGYTASEVAGVITIAAPPGTGATLNGTAVTTTVSGVIATPTNMAGGVTAVSPVARVSTITLGGTYQAKDLFTVVMNSVVYIGTGRASGAGTFIFIYKQRVYCPANTLLRYCKLNDATNWTDVTVATGAGFIDISAHTDGSERITSVAPYAGYAAIYTAKTVILYFLDPNATLVYQFQQLPNTGTIAAQSALGYGLDTFYLDTSGIRSLRARDASNTAVLNDIGTAFDPFIQEWIATVGNGVVASAIAVIEPFDSRYWLAVGSRIFVLSHFQTAGISGWSYYDLGLSFTAFVRIYNQLYARAGNTIYLYGGQSGAQYPAAGELDISASVPFMSANAPTLFKNWAAFDMACSGAWSVHFLVEPNDETQEIFYGTAVDTTYGGSIKSTCGRATMVALRFSCSSGGAVTLSNFSISFDEHEEKK